MFNKIFITPVGLACNLACSYCYNTTNDQRTTVTESGYSLISDEILDAIIECITPHIRNRLTVTWHGGEPLLARPSFYYRAIDRINKRLGDSVKVDYDMQTNATLVNDEWCKTFRDLSIRPSTSLDGPPGMHDANRYFPCGSGAYAQAMRGYNMLREHLGRCGVITVLNKANHNRIPELFEWVVANDIRSIDFQVCVKQQNQPDSMTALSDQESIDALTSLFDLWFAHDDPALRVRIYCDAIRGILGARPRVCSWCGGCGSFLSFDQHGNVFLCARWHVYPETSFGNLLTDPFSLILDRRYHGALQESIQRGQRWCQDCRWLGACGGGCPFLKFSKKASCDIEYPLCGVRRHLFNHIEEQVSRHCKLLKPGIVSSAQC